MSEERNIENLQTVNEKVFTAQRIVPKKTVTKKSRITPFLLPMSTVTHPAALEPMTGQEYERWSILHKGHTPCKVCCVNDPKAKTVHEDLCDYCLNIAVDDFLDINAST